MILERAPSAIKLLRGYAAQARYWLTDRAIAGGAFLLFVLLGLVERVRGASRRMRGRRPRLLWGPSAIVIIKYWSEAMRAVGYESRTCIDVDSAITGREDWDVCQDDFLGGRFSERLRRYAMFAWAIRQADVFLIYFNGGYLRGTSLEWQEFRLLRLAGKRLVVSPFGGDIAVPEYLGHIREPTLADYPQLAEQAPLVRRRVLHTLRWADVSIRNYQIGFQPRYDVVWPTQLGIDTQLWSPNGEISEADGRRGEVVVLHAPNHRTIKGTAHLEQAVTDLRSEGLKVDLRILERRPNAEIRAAMASADIVADQFLDPGYGLFSLEAMASGKPVLCRMSPIPEELRTPSLNACPILDSDPSRLKDNLRRLIESPTLRRELGDAGREFVLRHHSAEALGRDWGAIVEHAWSGEPLPERLLPPQPAASKS
jgi:glycosyltransferase involved in cell wall biosynthesis